MSVKSAAVFKSLCRLGFKVDLSISRDILQAIEHTILWEEMNALVSERFRVSFNVNYLILHDMKQILVKTKIKSN